MDSSVQIQIIKSQIDNLKFQIENIEIQNNQIKNGMMGMMGMMDTTKLGEQMVNLSIQTLNIGIQILYTGCTSFGMINFDKFRTQIKNISEQINSYAQIHMGQNNGMMMNDQMMTNLMMMPNPYMMNSPMMNMMNNPMMNMMNNPMMNMMNNQNMMMDNQMMEQNPMNSSKEYLNFTFKKANNENDENNIRIEKGKKVKELFDLYIDEAYGATNKQLKFVHNALKIDRNEQKKVEEVFKNGNKFTIKVFEIKPL